MAGRGQISEEESACKAGAELRSALLSAMRLASDVCRCGMECLTACLTLKVVDDWQRSKANGKMQHPPVHKFMSQSIPGIPSQFHMVSDAEGHFSVNAGIIAELRSVRASQTSSSFLRMLDDPDQAVIYWALGNEDIQGHMDDVLHSN